MKKNAKLLVVDDDEDNLILMAQILQIAGYEVLEARTGYECLERVHRDRPDIVLLDVMLPDINGLEVCKRIKADAELAATFVLMTSAKLTSSEDQADGLESGADGYIPLPVDRRELLARVHSLLRIKKAEEAGRRMALFAKFNPAPVFRFDQNGVIVASNPATEKLIALQGGTSESVKSFLSIVEDINLASLIRNGDILTREAKIR